MALWPFRRKSARKRSRSGATLSDLEAMAQVDRSARPRSRTANDMSLNRKGTLKKRRTEPAQGPRRSRSNSYSPGRRDSITVYPHSHARAWLDPSMRPNVRSFERIEEGYGWDQAPTLYGNRGSVRIPRRKSSRQKQPGHDREAEIRAMASSMSLRRARDTPTPPMRLGSKRMKAGVGFSQHWDGPSTEGSLPGTASIRSEMSTDSEHGAYRLKTLEALAPRPILRYEANPRWRPSNSYGPSRTTSQKKAFAERPVIPEETLKAHKRVDSLADGLDASDIRELMERDKRRRERKRLTEQARVEKRLARLAEKHLAAQISAAKDGAPPPQNLERGVVGRELAMLGLDPASTVVTSSKRRTTSTEPSAEGDRNPLNERISSDIGTRSPVNDFHRTNSIPLEAMTPQVEEGNPPKDIQSPPSMSSHSGASAKKGFKASDSTAKPLSDAARSRSTISPPPATVEEVENARSSGGMQKVRLSFTSLFKWASKNNRRGSGPSSFSNASREEMQAAIRNKSPIPPEESPAVAVAVGVGRTPTPTTPIPPAPAPVRRLSSGVPKRTRSRFREDLPELPLSPPDSRLASPDVVAALDTDIPKRGLASQSPEPPLPTPIDIPTPTRKGGDDGSRYGQGWRQYNTSPEPHTMSLASVDSEGSWLSGRLAGAGMGSRRPARRDRADSQATNTSVEEEHGIAEDEYFSRLTPARLMRTTSNPRLRKSTGEALPSSDEDEPIIEGDMKWGSVQARQHPTLVHATDRLLEEDLKSHDGVMNSGDEEHDSESDDIVDAENIGGLQRATSINLGKDGAQRISAGSAKLLEISPRESADSRQRSSAVFL